MQKQGIVMEGNSRVSMITEDEHIYELMYPLLALYKETSNSDKDELKRVREFRGKAKNNHYYSCRSD